MDKILVIRKKIMDLYTIINNDNQAVFDKVVVFYNVINTLEEKQFEIVKEQFNHFFKNNHCEIKMAASYISIYNHDIDHINEALFDMEGFNDHLALWRIKFNIQYAFKNLCDCYELLVNAYEEYGFECLKKELYCFSCFYNEPQYEVKHIKFLCENNYWDFIDMMKKHTNEEDDEIINNITKYKVCRIFDDKGIVYFGWWKQWISEIEFESNNHLDDETNYEFDEQQEISSFFKFYETHLNVFFKN